jgi:aldose sugar dehydrogenase
MRVTTCLVLVLTLCAARLAVDATGPAQAGAGGAGSVSQAQDRPRAAGPSPGATLWAEQCAGCHGTGANPGRAPNLFDDRWLNSVDDARIAAAINNGRPGTEMPAFGASLNDQQVFQLIQHIRTQTAIARPRPEFVSRPDGAVVRSVKQTVRLELVADGLMTPWALAFLPDGRLLVTERDGRLRIVQRGTLSEPIKGTPQPHVQQDGGYLDVEVHPDYARNGWIYLAYSEDRPGYVAPPSPAPAVDAPPAQGRGGRVGPPPAPSMTVIVRGRITAGNAWVDQEVIFRAPPDVYTTAGSHYGCRLLFDRQTHLFFTLGERGNQPNAQNLTNPLGKIHRVNDDGSVPADNPFVGTPGVVASIWSYGHRNPEGLAWDPVTGILWESEHGPNSADEINIIEKGHNYGWPMASRSGQPGIALSIEGMDDPVVYYTPTFAPAGIAFYTGTRYPGWKNSSLFVGGLLGQALRRLQIDRGDVVGQEVLFNQFGRVRDVVQGPDGLFYLALQDPTGIPNPAGGTIPLSASTPGRIVRLMPF